MHELCDVETQASKCKTDKTHVHQTTMLRRAPNCNIEEEDTLNDGLCRHPVAMQIQRTDTNMWNEIKEGRIFVNSKERTDDPIKNPWNWYDRKTGVGNRGISFPKTLLKADECFYIGDNRGETVWGIASLKDIRGKVMMHKWKKLNGTTNLHLKNGGWLQ